MIDNKFLNEKIKYVLLSETPINVASIMSSADIDKTSIAETLARILVELISFHKIQKEIPSYIATQPEVIKRMQRDLMLFNIGGCDGLVDALFYLGIITQEQSEKILKIILDEFKPILDLLMMFYEKE